MPPLRHIEISRQQRIDMAQQVFVERSRHAQCIVVSGLQRGAVLDQVNAQQQAARLALQRIGDIAQKRQRLRRRKIAQAGAGVEKHPVMGLDFIGQGQAS